MGDLNVLESNSDRKKGSQKGCKKKNKKNVRIASGVAPPEKGTTIKYINGSDGGFQDHENETEAENPVNDPALIAAETKKVQNSHNQKSKSKRFDNGNKKFNKKSTVGRELKEKDVADSTQPFDASRADKLHDNTNDTSNDVDDSVPSIKYTIVVSLPSVDFPEPAKTPTKSYNATDSELELHGDIEFTEDKHSALNNLASIPIAAENQRTPICSKSLGSIRSKTMGHDSNYSMKSILCSKSFVKEAEIKDTKDINKTVSQADIFGSILKILTPKSPNSVQKKNQSNVRNNKIPENKKAFTKKRERKTSKSKRRPKSIQRLVHEARGTSSCSQIIGEKKTLKSDTSKPKKRKIPAGAKKCGSAFEEKVADLDMSRAELKQEGSVE